MYIDATLYLHVQVLTLMLHGVYAGPSGQFDRRADGQHSRLLQPKHRYESNGTALYNKH